MNKHIQRLPRLARTLRTALPSWADDTIEENLAKASADTAEERFFYRTFGHSHLSVGLYDQANGLVASDPIGHPFPLRLVRPEGQKSGSGFILANDGLYFTFDGLDRWPDVPSSAAFVAAHISPAQLISVAARTAPPGKLTPSEFQLVGLLLEGLDLKTAAARIGATYDTKRKQIQKILEKLGLNSQTALVRTLALDLTVWLVNELLTQPAHDAETLLAKKHYGKTITINRVTVADSPEIPIWDFGARSGRPVLYFHSMLAPVILTRDLHSKLMAQNLRLLMMPRHFVGLESAMSPDTRQDRAISSLARALDYLTEDKLLCIGDSAGCGWAARFVAANPDRVSGLVLASTPQALPVTEQRTLFAEVSARIKQDRFVVSGMTRLYNTIARAPDLAQRALSYMYRQSPADLATLDAAFIDGQLADWLRLIANQAIHTSMDEVMNLQRNWTHDLRAIPVPLLFLHGNQDPICPASSAQDMADMMPNAAIHRFDDAGHFLLGQKFDEICRMLSDDQHLP